MSQQIPISLSNRVDCIYSPGCTRSGYSFFNLAASFSRRSRDRPATDHLRFVGNLAAMCVHTIVPVKPEDPSTTIPYFRATESETAIS